MYMTHGLINLDTELDTTSATRARWMYLEYNNVGPLWIADVQDIAWNAVVRYVYNREAMYLYG